MQMSPVIAIHLSAAVAATVIGPFALWSRLRRVQRPRLHRALGYAWVTLMLATALSAAFIRSTTIINLDGYTPIHLFMPVVLGMLVWAFVALAQGNIRRHRRLMTSLYIGGCLVAGSLTLLPNRYLGDLVWVQWLGWTDANAKVCQFLADTPGWAWALLAATVVIGRWVLRKRGPETATPLAPQA